VSDLLKILKPHVVERESQKNFPAIVSILGYYFSRIFSLKAIYDGPELKDTSNLITSVLMRHAEFLTSLSM